VQIVASADLDRVIGAVLDHQLTERAVDRALASPGLERLVIRVLESRLVDELTEQVLRSAEMERVVEHIATSPQVAAAVSQNTQTLAEEMLTDVRRRTHTVDDVAERTVRGWLRRPRPS
jgi:sirohydrochlorin ferrochelatase